MQAAVLRYRVMAFITGVLIIVVVFVGGRYHGRYLIADIARQPRQGLGHRRSSQNHQMQIRKDRFDIDIELASAVTGHGVIHNSLSCTLRWFFTFRWRLTAR